MCVSNPIYLHFKGEVGREEKTWGLPYQLWSDTNFSVYKILHLTLQSQEMWHERRLTDNAQHLLLPLLWAWSALSLCYLSLKINQCSPSTPPPSLSISSFFFPFLISHFLCSSAGRTGGGMRFMLCLSPTLNMLTFKLLLLLFLRYPLMNFYSTTY